MNDGVELTFFRALPSIHLILNRPQLAHVILSAFLVSSCSDDSRSPIAAETGTLDIVIKTIGTDFDADGYSLFAGDESVHAGVTTTISLDVAPGVIPIRLQGLAGNCFLMAPDTTKAEVVLSRTTIVALTVDCFGRATRLLYTEWNGTDNQIVINEPFLPGKSILKPALTFISHAVWSPDGTQIYISGTDRPLVPIIGGGLAIPNTDVFRMSVTGAGLTNVTASDGHKSNPSVSPDGRQVAFSNGDLWVIGADGSGRRRLTETGEVEEDNPRWSPTGDRILFSSTNPTSPDGESRIESIRPDGSDRRAIPVLAMSRARHPVLSPDGSKLAFVGVLSGTSTSQIFVANADGTSRRPLPGTRNLDQYLEWSANGRWILFTRFDNPSGTASRLHMVSIDGAVVVPLVTTGRPIRGSWIN